VILKFLANIFLLFLSANSFAQMATVEFIENKGQWDSQVKYKTKLPSGNLYLENNRLTYLFYNERDMERLHELITMKLKILRSRITS